MPLVIVGLGVALLLLLMTKFKLNAFISLIIVAILAGLAEGMPLADLTSSLSDGFGGQLDSQILVLGFGAMLGMVMVDSGAAQRIATTMLDKFGIKHVQLAMLCAAFALSITIFFEVGFVLLVPLVFTIVRQTRLKLIRVGLPMAIGLSTMHNFLPPHPGPTAVAGIFHVSLGLTLLYGLFIAIPVGGLIALAWPHLPFIKKMNTQIPEGLVSQKHFEDRDMPSFRISLFAALFPMFLIGGAAIADMNMAKDSRDLNVINFIGAATIALLLSLLLAVCLIGIRVGRSLGDIMKSCATSMKSMAMIIVVIGAGGGLQTGPGRLGHHRLHQRVHQQPEHLADHPGLGDRRHHAYRARLGHGGRGQRCGHRPAPRRGWGAGPRSWCSPSPAVRSPSPTSTTRASGSTRSSSVSPSWMPSRPAPLTPRCFPVLACSVSSEVNAVVS